MPTKEENATLQIMRNNLKILQDNVQKCAEELQEAKDHGWQESYIEKCENQLKVSIEKMTQQEEQYLSFAERCSGIHCPLCDATQITVQDKGFGIGKAAVGGLLLGPVGLLGGLIGSKQTMIVCLKCGHKWRAGN
jgi:tellurium resistance protein TerD